MGISTFMGLETNKRGLNAQQTALYTVGNNISNANTVGYTRQRVNLTATSGYPGIGQNTPMFAGHLGTGVTSESITRVRDTFLDKQYRQETNNLGYWTQQTNSISQMEDIVAEPSEYGLNAAYDEFYSAWQELANSPSSSAARQVVYTKASHLASSFNYINKQMTQVQTNLKYEAINTVDNINSILERIASLNNQIKTVEPNGYIPNELYDQRDVLLDELSQYIPISTESLYSGGLATDDAEGALNVYLVKADGSKQALVTASKTTTQVYNGEARDLYGKSTAAYLSLTTIDENGDSVALSKTDDFEALSGINFATKTTDMLTGGKKADDGTAVLEGPGYKIELDTSGIPSVKDSDGNVLASTVDATTGELTFTIPEQVDNDGNITVEEKMVTAKISQDAKGDYTGSATAITKATNSKIDDLSLEKGKLTSYAASYGYTATENDGTTSLKGFFLEKINDLDMLAREFAKQFNLLHEEGYGLSPDGTGSPTGLTFFAMNNADDTEISASNIKVSDEMKDLNNIAASSRDSEEGNGDLALQLSNLKTAVITDLKNTSASKFYESMVADIGTQGQKAAQMEYNSGTIRLTISNNRDSVTTVSLDEEMTDMIRFQQAYNASARMMTVVDETLDKIINGMGRVGL